MSDKQKKLEGDATNKDTTDQIEDEILEDDEYIDEDAASFLENSEVVYEEMLDNNELKKLEKNQMNEDDDALTVDDDGDEDYEDEDNEDDVEYVNDSVCAFTLHTDAVYKISACSSNQQVLVASASGDDSAYLFRLKKNEDTTQNINSQGPSTTTETKSNDQMDSSMKINETEETLNINPNHVVSSKYTTEALFHLTGHTDSVVDIAFSPDKKLVATGSMDGTIVLWNVNDGKVFKILEGPSEAITWIEWHPTGKVIICGSEEGTAWMWSSNGKCLQVFAGHSKSVTCGGFTSNGKKIITGSDDGSLRVWDPMTAQAIWNCSGDNITKESVLCAKSRPLDASVVLFGTQDGKGILCNIETKKVLSTLGGHDSSVETVDFSSIPTLDHFAASGTMDGKILLFDLNNYKIRQSLSHSAGVIKVLFDESMPILYSCSVDKSICLWDIRTGKCEQQLRGHRDIVMDFQISKFVDTRLLISCSDDNAVLAFKL